MFTGLYPSCKKTGESPDPILPLSAEKQITFSPEVAFAGEVITLTGSFDPDKTKDAVLVGDKPAVISTATASEIKIIAPADAANGKITVTVNGKTASSSAEFRFNNIWIAGTENDGNGKNTPVAKYWKNGFSKALTDGTHAAYGTGIALSGTDVYVSGYETGSTGKIVAKYWKNGAPVALSDGSTSVYSSGIAVSGSDVYVCGYEFVAQTVVAKYWKNGIAVNLSSLSEPAYTSAIKVVGGDVYVSGTIGYKDIATYWKNGAATKLSDPMETNYGSGIAIVGPDVYVCAFDESGLAGRTASYYKNGIRNGITSDPAKVSPSTSGIAVNGTDIYISGTEYGSGGKYSAKYYKNGIGFSLTDGTNFSTASAIWTEGNNLIVVGTENNRAKMWKNGVATSLSVSDAQTTAVVVAP